MKVTIELTFKHKGDDDEIASLVNDQLDAGVIQDLINEWAQDRLGIELEFVNSSARTEDATLR